MNRRTSSLRPMRQRSQALPDEDAVTAYCMRRWREVRFELAMTRLAGLEAVVVPRPTRRPQAA